MTDPAKRLSELKRAHRANVSKSLRVARNNFYQGYFCRVYRCSKKNEDGKGYCSDHTSELRTGLLPYSAGSCPVRREKA